MTTARLPPALFILSGGGFSFENRCLLRLLASNVQPVYLVTTYGGRPGDRGIPSGPFYDVPQFASVMEPSFRRSAIAFVATLFMALRVVRRERIAVVVAIGCSHSIPMLIAARLAGCRTVFIESIARTDRLSRTGSMIYYLRLARLFIVQWPELKTKYGRASLGTVL